MSIDSSFPTLTTTTALRVRELQLPPRTTSHKKPQHIFRPSPKQPKGVPPPPAHVDIAQLWDEVRSRVATLSMMVPPSKTTSTAKSKATPSTKSKVAASAISGQDRVPNDYVHESIIYETKKPLASLKTRQRPCDCFPTDFSDDLDYTESLSPQNAEARAHAMKKFQETQTIEPQEIRHWIASRYFIDRDERPDPEPNQNGKPPSRPIKLSFKLDLPMQQLRMDRSMSTSQGFTQEKTSAAGTAPKSQREEVMPRSAKSRIDSHSQTHGKSSGTANTKIPDTPATSQQDSEPNYSYVTTSFGLSIFPSFEGELCAALLSSLSLPGYCDKKNYCACFLRAIFSRGEGKDNHQTTRVNWARDAKSAIINQLRIRRGDLHEDKLDVLRHLHHFGYLFFGASVEIWEMRRRSSTDSAPGGSGPSSMPIPGHHHSENKYPYIATLVAITDLTKPEEAILFSNYHKMIMIWAQRVHGPNYRQNLTKLTSERDHFQKWTLSEAEAEDSWTRIMSDGQGGSRGFSGNRALRGSVGDGINEKYDSDEVPDNSKSSEDAELSINPWG